MQSGFGWGQVLCVIFYVSRGLSQRLKGGSEKGVVFIIISTFSLFYRQK